MNKSELVTEVQARVGLSKTHVAQVIQACCEVIAERLQAGEDVSLPPLGRFQYKLLAPRKQRNPQTGAFMEVPERATVRFRPSSSLKRRVN